MQNKIYRFLVGSLVVICAVCVTVFGVLASYLNRENEQAISQIGNIYMASMNDRISKHFETMTDHRLEQMETLTKTIPPAYRTGKESLAEWLEYNGQARGFDSVSYCHADGSLEIIYGEEIRPYSSCLLYTSPSPRDTR